jgi:hypothetical protein
MWAGAKTSRPHDIDTSTIEGEENFHANAIVEEGTQITEQGSHVLLHDGKEKLNEESNMRQKVEEQECVDKDN